MKRWLLGLALALAVVAFVVIMVVPIVALRFVNGVLATSPDYHASADDLDLLPLDGAVAVDGIRFVRLEVPDASPFLEIQRVIVTPHLGAMLHGDRIVDIVLEAPKLTYVVGPTAATSQTGIDPEWVAAVLRQYPATVDHLRIVSGTVSYHDVSASPDVVLSLTGLDVIGTNLANLTHVPEEKFAHLTAKGDVLESGALELHMDLAPYQHAPTFTLHADVRHVPLVRMNNALRAYGNFDVQAGTASVAIAMTAADGGYSGKVDPVLTDVKVVQLSKEPELEKHPLRFAWEALIGTAKDVAEIVTPRPERPGPPAGRDPRALRRSVAPDEPHRRPAEGLVRLAPPCIRHHGGCWRQGGSSAERGRSDRRTREPVREVSCSRSRTHADQTQSRGVRSTSSNARARSFGGSGAYGNVTTGGSETRMLSVRPRVLSPNVVPRS
jgi:hypothetical protein